MFLRYLEDVEHSLSSTLIATVVAGGAAAVADEARGRILALRDLQGTSMAILREFYQLPPEPAAL